MLKQTNSIKIIEHDRKQMSVGTPLHSNEKANFFSR